MKDTQTHNTDLISKFEAIDRIDTYFCVTCYVKKEGGACGGCMIKDVKEIIDDTNAVDAVEVVRCKDCLNFGMKASIKYDWYRDDVRLCMLHGIAVLPNDYCSGGVKMDAEVEG